MEFIEIIGYLASLLIIVSLMMTDIKWLRFVNFIGCFLFVVYALGISAYPVAIMNAVASGINIYHLYRMRKK